MSRLFASKHSPTTAFERPGRPDNGNFVVSEFTTVQSASGDGDALPVKLVSSTATFNQAGYAVSMAIDSNPNTGWAISPETGSQTAASKQKVSWWRRWQLLTVTLLNNHGRQTPT